MRESLIARWSRSRRHGLIAVMSVVILVVSMLASAVSSPSDQSEEARALIDVGSSSPLMEEAVSTEVDVPVYVSCTMPNPTEECDTSSTLHYRIDLGVWRSVPGQGAGALGINFSIPIPHGSSIDYYVEVRERETNTTKVFPNGGRDSPLRVHLVASSTPVQLQALDFDDGREPDEVISIPWGKGPREAGLILGDEGSTIGPQAMDVDHTGTIYLLDQVNDRIQILAPHGDLIDEIPLELGPLGDLALGGDGTAYVLNDLPEGPGSHPVVHEVGLDAGEFSEAPTRTVHTPESEPALLRVVDHEPWVYGTPSDAWRRLHMDGSLAPVQMGMPSEIGEVLRRVRDFQRIDLLALGTRVPIPTTLHAPTDRMFGELALVEPLENDLVLLVARTWREQPNRVDQHEVVILSREGDVIEHFAVRNGEWAETAPLSQYRLGQDGSLYQLWSDPMGLEIRRFSLNKGGP